MLYSSPHVYYMSPHSILDSTTLKIFCEDRYSQKLLTVFQYTPLLNASTIAPPPLITTVNLLLYVSTVRQ